MGKTGGFMQNTRKVVLLANFNVLNDRKKIDALSLMNLRIKGKNKTRNTNQKLIGPDEFLRNKAISEGKIFKAFEKLILLAENPNDYPALLYLVEKNISNLDLIISPNTQPSLLREMFYDAKNNTNRLDLIRNFTAAFIEEQNRLKSNYQGSIAMLNSPNLIFIEQLRNYYKTAQDKGLIPAHYFLATDETSLSEMINTTSTYMIQGKINLRDVQLFFASGYFLELNKKDIADVCLFLLDREKTDKQNLFYISDEYNRVFAFKLKQAGFDNQLLISPPTNETFYADMRKNKKLDLAVKEGITTIVKMEDLAKAIVNSVLNMLNRMQNNADNSKQADNKQQPQPQQAVQKDSSQEQKDRENHELQKVIESFFNDTKT